MSKPDYDTTIARIAGNIASGLAIGLADPMYSEQTFIQGVERISKSAVCLARAIVAEVKRTQPVAALPSSPAEKESTGCHFKK